MSRLSIVSKGIVKENPVFVSLLGLCPLLAVSAMVSDALGMGIATTLVLLGSNVSVAILRNIIPDKVRIPCFIVIIAGFVTLLMMLFEAYAYTLHQALGIFLPLITVNCIIFARAEVFARKNKVCDSVLDAVGMGLGFTFAMVTIATMREVLGRGSWFGIELPVLSEFSIPLFGMAPGGFVAFGLIIAIVNKISKGKAAKRDFGCSGCPAACGRFSAGKQEVTD